MRGDKRTSTLMHYQHQLMLKAGREYKGPRSMYRSVPLKFTLFFEQYRVRGGFICEKRQAEFGSMQDEMPIRGTTHYRLNARFWSANVQERSIISQELSIVPCCIVRFHCDEILLHSDQTSSYFSLGFPEQPLGDSSRLIPPTPSLAGALLNVAIRPSYPPCISIHTS